jgi:hypothetical protein
MPLIPATLIAGFTELFQGPPIGPMAAAFQMANTYALYAQTGIFGPTLPVFTGLERVSLATMLGQAMSVPGPAPPAFGASWALGLTNFWLAPPIIVAGGGTGAVVSILGTTSLAGALDALVAIPFNPAPQAAAFLATALDIATRTCIAAVVIPPSPSPVPVPIL